MKSKDLVINVLPVANATTYGTAFAGFDTYDAIKGVATLTQATGGTQDIYIQHSWDDGATWYDCAHFAQLAAGSTAFNYDFSVVLDSTIRAVGKGTVSSAAPALAASTIVAGPWGNKLRMVAVVPAGVTVLVNQTVRLLSWESRK